MARGMTNDEYMGRLLRAVVDLEVASRFDKVDVMRRRITVALSEAVQSVLDERIADMHFASPEDARLHAEFVASSVSSIPVGPRWGEQ